MKRIMLPYMTMIQSNTCPVFNPLLEKVEQNQLLRKVEQNNQQNVTN
jgi:hypothetical protein